MKRALIIHGIGSNSTEHWFQSAKKGLENLGYKTSVPNMPNPNNPNTNEWVNVIKDFNPSKKDILIGFSLGSTAILKFLEKTNKKIEKSVLIATPNLETKNKKINSFLNLPLNWEKIRENCNNFFLLYQKNDYLISLEHGKNIAKKLQTTLKIVPGSNHFLAVNLDIVNIIKNFLKK